MNKNTFKKITWTLAVAGGVLASVASDNHPGTWISATASGCLDTNRLFKVQIKEENRFTEKHLSEVHSQISVGYKLTDWFEIAPRAHVVYLRNDSLEGRSQKSSHISGKKVDHGWDRELRVGADATFSHNLYGWKLSDRNRVVWREYEDEQGFWRVRNRFQVVSPWKWTEYKINPYTSFELFWDDGKASKNLNKNDKFDQWRFIAGTKVALTKRISLDLYYLLQEKKSGTYDANGGAWDDNQIIGLDLGFTF